MSRRSALLLVVLCLAGLSFALTPDRLATVGIMDTALTSDNPLIRRSALKLFLFFRISLLVLSIFLIALSLAVTRIEASDWFKRRIHEGSSFPKAYVRHQRTLWNCSSLVALCSLTSAILYISLGNGFGRQTLPLINAEDGVIEWMSALILLATSLIAIRVSSGMPNKNYRRMHIFLAVLFFIMFGEEISWGQRVFGFSTPEQLARINVQGETNLHNSFGYIFDHLFILCFFFWGCVVPLLYWFEPIWRWYQSRIGLPFPSVGLGLAMLGVTLFQEQITDTLFGVVSGLHVPEIRELLSALCFMLLMLESKRLSAR
ncbi:hypothetical protein SAMN05444004_107137 [Jannaschia faecimaris]|uniref:Uncharacterized protein n=1 Tax=Jannaschia faecimaris TaxID=1244108 RepID=A0A1H3R2Z7_9RHOB|nr:hypothetical protein [Jannaschia faecimaris]SDZ20174.1 hypothetical protein SAMN05444004_107137 [Jannaschia faecimaris]